MLKSNENFLLSSRDVKLYNQLRYMFGSLKKNKHLFVDLAILFLGVKQEKEERKTASNDFYKNIHSNFINNPKLETWLSKGKLKKHCSLFTLWNST